MEVILSHPGLQDLRRFLLMTADAQGLYTQYGFTVWEYPDRCMSRRMGAPYSELKNTPA